MRAGPFNYNTERSHTSLYPLLNASPLNPTCGNKFFIIRYALKSKISIYPLLLAEFSSPILITYCRKTRHKVRRTVNQLAKPSQQLPASSQNCISTLRRKLQETLTILFFSTLLPLRSPHNSKLSWLLIQSP